jgi:hypothetical protein
MAHLRVQGGGDEGGWQFLTSFQKQQQHNHRRFRLDAVPLAGEHVNPCPWFGVQVVIAQRQLCLALEEVKNSGHGGGVFGKLLALGEAEDHRLDLFIIEEGPTQDSLFRWLGFLGLSPTGERVRCVQFSNKKTGQPFLKLAGESCNILAQPYQTIFLSAISFFRNQP